MRDSNGQYPGLRRSCRQLFVGFVIITGIAVFGVYWDVAALQHCSSYSAALLGVGMTIMVFQAGRSYPPMMDLCGPCLVELSRCLHGEKEVNEPKDGDENKEEPWELKPGVAARVVHPNSTFYGDLGIVQDARKDTFLIRFPGVPTQVAWFNRSELEEPALAIIGAGATMTPADPPAPAAPGPYPLQVGDVVEIQAPAAFMGSRGVVKSSEDPDGLCMVEVDVVDKWGNREKFGFPRESLRFVSRPGK